MKANIRCFGLFHAKMAASRLVLNEHWGVANAALPGTLWWEHNTLLHRKPISGGWRTKKAAPWKPTHELLTMSCAAHVIDGFRIYCGDRDFETWTKTCTFSEFEAVADRVYEKLFTTLSYDEAKDNDDRDTTLENTILYNRDCLLYLLFSSAIKRGDIGLIVHILRVWMVMMRTPKTMPKYADAIFETLGRLETYDPSLKYVTIIFFFCALVDNNNRKFFLHNWLVNVTGNPNGFKEVDLLQEHHNFWLKVRHVCCPDFIFII
jgi:hypothetical protein